MKHEPQNLKSPPCGNDVFGCRQRVERSEWLRDLWCCKACARKASRFWCVAATDLPMVLVAVAGTGLGDPPGGGRRADYPHPGPAEACPHGAQSAGRGQGDGMKWPYTPQEFAKEVVSGQGWWRLAWAGDRCRVGCRHRVTGVLKSGGPLAFGICYRHLGFGIWWRTK
jgi:hypothetical protein